MAISGSFVFVMLVLLNPTTTEVLADICDTATVLDSLPQRLSGYVLGEDQLPLCDSFLPPGWYKMGPNVLATTAEGCGTTYPLYMIGTLPETGTKDITVCIGNTKGPECSTSRTIQTKRCSQNIYIFKLIPTYGCPEAYCIESLNPTNDTREPPEISVIPSIITSVVRPQPQTNELKFYCELDRHLDTTYYYTVKWYQSDGTSLVMFIWASDPLKFDGNFREETALSEKILLERGHKLGIRVMNKSATVRDQDEAIVNLKLTVPFGCEDGNDKCYIVAIVLVPIKNDVCKAAEVAHRTENFEQKPCGVLFWNNEVGVPKKLRLDALLGEDVKPQSWKLTARLATLPTYTAHPLFANYQLDPIMVNLETDGRPISGKLCYSHNDPHMRSFDGLNYENQNGGTFILYKHTMLAVQVQIQTRNCSHNSRRAFCNCGAAVAVGRDVFVVNNCDGEVPRFRSCMDGVMKDLVHESSGIYIIYLPTGGTCHITKRYSGFINVEVYPATSDFNKSEGLCGVFDGDKSNDRQVRPGSTQTDPNLSWRVDTSESLFEEENDKKLPQWRERENLCSCKASGSIPVNVAHCHVSKVKHCERSEIQPTRLPCTIVRQKRRSPRDTYQRSVNGDNYVNTKTSFHIQETKRPWKLWHSKIQKRDVYDEVTARQDCLAALNTTVFRLCSNVPGIDVEPYINDCVMDAILMNSMDWAITHLEGVKSHCKHQVYINQPFPPEMTSDPSFENNATESESDNNSTTNTNGTVTSSEAFTPEFLDKVEELSCTNDCFGNGVCNKGQCECDPDFGDVDCSMVLSDPPVMKGIPDGGLCDLTLRNCEKTSVFGDDFVESEQLLCRLLPFHVTDPSSVRYATTPKTQSALRLSFAEVSCPLDKHVIRRKRSELSNEPDGYIARGYSISISNDGANYGLSDSIVIFDSTCVNCTKDGDKIYCAKDASYCLRNGLCYALGESAGCQTCSSTGSSDANWDKGLDCQPLPVHVQPKSELWIIGPVLGSVGGLAVVFGVSVFIWKWKGKKTDTHNAKTTERNVNVYDELQEDTAHNRKENYYDTLEMKTPPNKN